MSRHPTSGEHGRERAALALRRDPWFWSLAALALAQTLVLAPLLLYPDLRLSYPFPGGDGYDWIANGLFFAGEDVAWSARPPLVPLVLAALERLALLPWYPVLTLLAHHGACLAAYALVAPAWGRAPAAAVTAALLVNTGALYNSLLVMADVPAVLLMMLALLAFVAAHGRPRLYPAAGLLAGLSAVTQQTALLLPVAAVVTVVGVRRHHLRAAAGRRWLALGGVGFVLPVAAWFVGKRLATGRWADVGARQWELLRFHLDDLDFYAAAALSLAGWPGVLLALGGTGVILWRWRRRGVDHRSLAVLATLALVVGFFALLYDWNAERFLLYALFPAALPTAAALARLPRAAAVAAAALLVLTAAAPRPHPELARRWTLWPLPTVQAVARRPEDSRNWRLERLPLGKAAAATTYGRVLDERRRYDTAPPVALPDPVRFAAYRSAVFLDDGSLGDSRWVTADRLGNVLRKRVKQVPAALYPPSWWGWAGAEPVATFDRYRVYGVRLQGLEERHMVALARRGGAGPDPEVPPEAPPPAAALRRGAALARAVDAHTPFPEGLLVVFPRPRGTVWHELLPFASRTTALFMLPPGEADEVEGMLRTARVRGEIRLDGLRLLRAEIAGRQAVVVPPRRGGG